MFLKSRHGWFVFRTNGEIYRWFLSLGKFEMSWENKR